MGKRGPSSKQGTNSNFIGKAGEYAVAAQLMIRECLPHWPSIDVGYDMYTNNGCRIQVRTSKLLPDGKKSAGSYWFNFSRTKYISHISSGVKKVKKPPLSQVCDVAVCWGIDQNRFWVIPASLISNVNALVLGVENKTRFAGKVQPMRDMVEAGSTVTATASHFGINRISLCRLLKSGKEEQKETVFAKARAYENAWEQILDFGNNIPG